MPRESLATEGLVLELAAAGEHHRRLFLLTAEHGVQLCMFRLSRKNASPVIDLFDDVEVQAERTGTGPWFIREHRVTCSRKALARSYTALEHACTLATLLKVNYRSPGCHRNTLDLARTLFSHLGASSRPDLVFLKGLFMLARAEGYPVEQEWLEEQDPLKRSCRQNMLHLPIRDQQPAADAVEQACQSLLAYLRHHTDIHLP